MKKASDYIIFPLDMPDFNQAMEYVRLLKDHIGLFKVGLELFISQGPDIIKAIYETAGPRIFLDLKLHDIPETVKRAIYAVSSLGAEFVTIHCDGGEEMLREVTNISSKGTKILAVTVLTSMDKKNLLRLGYKDQYANDLSELVLLKAKIALEAGCHGIVCSGFEVARIKRELGNNLIAVTPGIRPEWSLVKDDDQKRIVTPRKAIISGSDYIVVGRPLRDADDPLSAAKKIADEIAVGLGPDSENTMDNN